MVKEQAKKPDRGKPGKGENKHAGAKGRVRKAGAPASTGRPKPDMHAKGSAKHKPANGKGASPQQRKPPAKATASSAATPDVSTPADKKAAKQAKLERKKPVLALVKKVVALWDEMRPSQVGAERKHEISAQVVTAGTGHLKELALNHASARAVQAAAKHGGKDTRAAVWAECRESCMELAMSPHGSFVVRKLIATADAAELSGASCATSPGRPAHCCTECTDSPDFGMLPMHAR